MAERTVQSPISNAKLQSPAPKMPERNVQTPTPVLSPNANRVAADKYLQKEFEAVYSREVEILIKSHVAFTLACSTTGVELVLNLVHSRVGVNESVEKKKNLDFARRKSPKKKQQKKILLCSSHFLYFSYYQLIKNILFKRYVTLEIRCRQTISIVGASFDGLKSVQRIAISVWVVD